MSKFSDDDVIHIFTIEKGNGIHTLKYGNDEFAVVRSTVMPDRSSGKDGREVGAHFLKEGEGHEDTVSFLDGDRTDYYSFRSWPASILLVREDSAVRLEISPDFLSGKAHDSLGRYIIAESESGLEKIRVTADPESPRQRYAIRAFSGQLRKKKLVDQLLRDAAAKNDFFIFSKAASALVEFAPTETLEYCRTLERNAGELMHIACIYYLYPHGNDADRKKIDNMAPGASRNLKDAIESIRAKSIKK